MLVIVLMLSALSKTETSLPDQPRIVEIDCEKVDHFIRFEKCCFLNDFTVIDAVNVTFAEPEKLDVEAILFSGNENIKFLPSNVYKKFPNLEVYLARKAAIREISALNFQWLFKLKWLDLQRNQIEFIPDDCFKGLTSLYKINLGSLDCTLLWKTYEFFLSQNF